MNSYNSTSKKLILNKNNITNPKEKNSPVYNIMRRFKSQETYSSTSNKIKPKETNNENSKNGSNQNLNEFTSLSKSKELKRTNFYKISNSKLDKKSEQVHSVMNNYIKNKPLNNSKEPTMISKIMKDESIQELNTEENSKFL